MMSDYDFRQTFRYHMEGDRDLHLHPCTDKYTS